MIVYWRLDDSFAITEVAVQNHVAICQCDPGTQEIYQADRDCKINRPYRYKGNLRVALHIRCTIHSSATLSETWTGLLNETKSPVPHGVQYL
jgi:hypothetical protein